MSNEEVNKEMIVTVRLASGKEFIEPMTSEEFEVLRLELLIFQPLSTRKEHK